MSHSDAQGPSGYKRLGGWAAPLALLLAPVIALVALQLWTEDRLGGLEASPQPILVRLREVQSSRQQPATAVLSWGESAALLSPGWSGIVTKVYILPGQIVSSGDSVLAVDGVDRIAAATPTPFWRVLRTPVSGDDVAALQELLTELGHYDGEISGVYNTALANAVGAWSTELGFPSPIKVFDPSWVVYLPSDHFSVGSTLVRVGEPAPGVGAPVAESPVPLLSIDLRGQAGALETSAEDWRFVWGPDAAFGFVDPSQVPGSGIEIVQALTEPGTLTLDGWIELQTPMSLLSVPAPAVVTSSDGDMCVWIGSAEGYEAVVVQMVDGIPGAAYVTGELGEEAEVLVNPREMLPNPSCPSN